LSRVLEFSLSAAGMEKEHLPELAEETLRSGIQLSNPRVATKEDVIGIFRKLLEGDKTQRVQKDRDL